jgi:mRNA-degrading endonuclease YafQ of YafQ-DinJ toxin-antitoxin module
MYRLIIEGSFRKAYSKLSRVEQRSVDNKLVLLAQNPWHKSLRVKKIRTTDFFECSVNMDIRIVFLFEGDAIIILLDIGHHDQLIKRAGRRKP